MCDKFAQDQGKKGLAVPPSLLSPSGYHLPLRLGKQRMHSGRREKDPLATRSGLLCSSVDEEKRMKRRRQQSGEREEERVVAKQPKKSETFVYLRREEEEE